MDIEPFKKGMTSTENGFLSKGIIKDRGYTSIINHSLPEAHCFQFMFDSSQELVEFGMEMMERKLFNLPFKICLYKFPVYENPDREIQEGQYGSNYILIRERDGEWFFWSVMHVNDRKDEPVCDVCGRFVDEGVKAKDPSIAWKFSDLKPKEVPFSIQSSLDIPWSEAIKSFDKKTQDAFQLEVGKTIASIVGLTMSLSSKDIEVINEPASEKLNKARKKKGKDLLKDHSIVRINSDAMRFIRENSPNGTHASPRMHWRRGHLRHLQSGEIIPIAPCIVGKRNDSDTLPPREYEVQK